MATINDSYDITQYSYSNLPTEIIIKIFKYLSSSDLNASSLTCRRWFEASKYPEFYKKICLNFTKIHFSDQTMPINLFLKSVREYQTIQLDQVDFAQDDDYFWLHFSEYINEIVFISCDMREKKFNSILGKLTNLKILKIVNCREIFMSGRLFEETNEKNKNNFLIESLKNVISLSITHNRYLTDAILHRILVMTPKLQHLNLSGCHISFHKGLYLKFYPNKSIGISESVLTFHYISQLIKTNGNYLKSLNFSETLIDGTALTTLSEMNNLLLEKLELVFCDQLTNFGIINLVQKQINLIHLDLSLSVRLTDQSLIEICNCLKELKILKLKRCRALTNLGIIHLENIKKLEILDISECENLSGEGIMNGLVKNPNFILQEFNVSALNICEKTVIKIAKNLPNLKKLNLSFCFNGVTELATQIIFKHLIWLRELNLDFCDKVSDAALTGMSMTEIVRNYEEQELTSTSSSQNNEINENQPIIVHQNEQNNPIEHLIRFENGVLNEFRHVKISLGSKAEEEILKDAKQKKLLTKFCEEDLLNKDSSGLSVSRLKGLKVLRLTSCNRISDISLQYNFQLPELTEISLGKCQQISIVGIKELVNNCPSLENVNLAECHNINDKTIELITKNLKRLKHLYLERCIQLTDFSLDYITIYCKTIKTVDIRGCRSMSSEPNLRLVVVPTLRQILSSKPGPYMTPDSKQPKPPVLPPFRF